MIENEMLKTDTDHYLMERLLNRKPLICLIKDNIMHRKRKMQTSHHAQNKKFSDTIY